VHGELEAEIRRTFDPVRGGADGKGFPKVEWWREEVLAGMLARVFSRSSAVAGAALAADAAWDPRAWRFTVRFPDESGGVLPLPAAELGTAVIFPRLERLVFEPLDGK
jgi:hypothetical protein